MAFSDHFSGVASEYAAFRPLYPEALFDWLGQRLDGLTVDLGDWWFNLRPSNTEPLLRLNVEADTEATMVSLRDEVLGVVRG